MSSQHGTHSGAMFGADLGSKRDLTAGVKVYFCQESGELFISREIYQHGVPIAHVPELFDTLVPNRDALIMIDGSLPQSIEVLRGTRVQSAGSEPRPRLDQNGLVIDRSSKPGHKIYRFQERESVPIEMERHWGRANRRKTRSPL